MGESHNNNNKTQGSTMQEGTIPNEENLGDEFISELNKLSIKERDNVTHDLHGISSISEEDPDFVRRSLDAFESELKIIPDENKAEYLLARNQNPDYVSDEKNLLMFLRSCDFDSKAAATRYVSFFRIKLEIFGEEKVGRDIRVDDLSEEDMVCLESGYAQILKARDRADRAIFFLVPMADKFNGNDTYLRVWYLVTMFALRDVNTQQKGMVLIAYNLGRWKSTSREAVFRSGQLVWALPVRFAGVHYCFDEERMKGIFYLAMFAAQRAARLRVRFHLGTDMEIIYTLMTFGISNDAIPIDFSGSLRLQAHNEYVRNMRLADDLDNDNVDRIYLPLKYDVLLGRGKPLQKYSGNLNYHYIVESYHRRYEEAVKGVKAELAMEIVKKIHSQGGRFLKQDDTVGWTVITDNAAKSKVSHTFRNHRIAARTALKKALAAKEKAAAAAVKTVDIVGTVRPIMTPQQEVEHNKKKLRLFES